MSLEAEFQQHLTNGELHVQLCHDCQHKQMYPRQRCLKCYSKNLGWARVSGAGTLLSYTVMHAAPPTAFQEDLPYALGIIKLEEGPQLLARLHPQAEGEFSEYHCDQAVFFTPADADEVNRRPVAWFSPAQVA